MKSLWEKFKQKFVGDKAFYLMVLAVAVPIMIQNGITNFVSLLDNIMVGVLGTEQMSGVGIVNQLIFVFNLACFGAVSGVGIYTAQYYGSRDDEGITQTFRLKVIVSLVLGGLVIAIFSLFGTPLINLYLNEGSQSGDLTLTLQFGQEYLAVMLWGLVPFALTQAYSSTLRETGHTVLPMVAGFSAVGVNAILNWLLIFGKFGLPVLGVKGAAIASVISRFVELGVLVVVTHTNSKYNFASHAFERFFHINGELVAGVAKRGTPLFVNEVLWGLGMSVLAKFYSERGLSAMAGYEIASTVINVFNIAYIALGNSVGIIVGRYLGAGKYEKAQSVDNKMIAFSIAVGTVMAIVMACCARLLTTFYNTTQDVKDIATNLMIICACCMPFQSFLHSCYFTLRSGGRTIITFIYDSAFVWVVSVPFVLAMTRLTTLPVEMLYLCGCGIEILKCIAGYIMLKKKIWINKIV